MTDTIPDHLAALERDGYAVIRGLYTADEMARLQEATRALYEEGVAHPRSWRHGNRMFEINEDPSAGHVLLQAHWFALTHPLFEQFRRHPKLLEVLRPILSDSINQSTNQIHWKPPGTRYADYSFHQDAKFVTGVDRNEIAPFLGLQVTTGLAIERQGRDNGGLSVFPGSHKLGYLGLTDEGEGYIMGGGDQRDELRAVGLDPEAAVTPELEAGDMILWTLLTVHGSGANRSETARPLMINAYTNAILGRGETTFVEGRGVPLDPDNLRIRKTERPEPHYLEPTDWMPPQ